MKVIKTAIPEVCIIEPRVFTDNRGFFMESYNRRAWKEAGITDDFCQDNHSRSSRGTVRGLHYQTEPGQAKLVRVVVGSVLDVAVDIRHGSPTFGKWIGVELSEQNKRQLYIPVGFAHGFCVLSDTAEFLYKVTSYYDPEAERGIAWNDPEIGVDWPTDTPVLSERDKHHPKLSEADVDYIYQS